MDEQNQQARFTYVKALETFDWEYAMSDDAAVVRRGNLRVAELQIMQRAIDPSGSIWMRWRGDRHGAPLPQVVEAVAA